MPIVPSAPRSFVLGTAGHVDHGKTALVRALTGRDTDRLPEEKRRGISIELGFAPWDLGEGVTASLIDVPGHRRLVHTMIAGAAGMELVLLVVAADEGVMPQTREHVAVCELLGVTRAIVVITKIDAVDADLAGVATGEALDLLGDRWTADIVRCSAKTGEGLETLRSAARTALLRVPPRPVPARARMSVDRVFTVRGAGTIVTGTLLEGRIETGQRLYLVGAKGARETHARSLQVHDRVVDVAVGPTRLAVNLGGIALAEAKRGDVLTDDESLRTTSVIDVALRGSERRELARGAAVTFHSGTARASAKALRVEDDAVRLRLSAPVAVAGGDRFVLRGSRAEGPSGAILGGGIVLDVGAARVRSRARWKDVLTAMSEGDPERGVRALVAERAPYPLERAALAGRFAVKGPVLARAADRLADQGELVRLGERAWLEATALEALAAKARDLVESHVRAFPLDRGMPVETLRARLGRAAGRDAAERALKLAQKGPSSLSIEGDVARPRAAVVNEGVALRLEAARRALDEAGKRGLSTFAAGEATGAAPAEVRALLAHLVRDGVAVALGDLWFPRALDDELRAAAAAHLVESRELSVVTFKELSGLARKQAVLFLEHFDRIGLTRRKGDSRVRA